MILREIVVNHYGPLRDICLTPAAGLQVVYGPNESGKTLLIDALLKLMLGDNLKDFECIDRVQGLPAGRVVLNWQDRELVLDGTARLDRKTEFSAAHLRNVFVIRNKDVQLKNQADYFHGLNDQLTGLETRRLEQLRVLIQQAAALTNPTSAARLSRSDKFARLAERAETADQLAEEIQQYAAEAREQQLDRLELNLEQKKDQLVQVEKQIKEQQQAEIYHCHQETAALIARHQSLAQQVHDLAPFTREEEKTFLSLASQIQSARQEIDAAQRELTAERQQCKQLREATDRARAEDKLLASKHSGLIELARRVEGTGHRGSFPLKPLSVLALLAVAAVLAWAALAGENDLLFFLPGTCIGAALWLIADEVRNSKTKTRLLRRGAALGILASTVEELASAVDQRKDELETHREQARQVEARYELGLEHCSKLENAIADKRKLADQKRQQLETRLQAIKTTNVEEFSEKVGKAEQLRNERQYAEQQLTEALGTDSDWQQAFSARKQPAAPGIAYQPGLLDQLRQQQDQLRLQCDQLREQLLDHKHKLAEFATACRELAVEDELGIELPRHFPGLDILGYATDSLKQFVAFVEKRYQAACTAIGLLEEIEKEEREQMGRLLGTDKPVQQLFATITGGRYRKVALTPELDVVVYRQDGLRLPASSLSQGTFDQLYLSLRISLAGEILGGQAGFLILDDAFLCADSARQQRLLDLLTSLADRGWQIIYFTSDRQLADKMGERSANNITTLSPLA